MDAPHPDSRATLRHRLAEDLAGLLGRRFGDGLVYVQGESDRRLLARANALGLVSTDGQLTRAGRRYWQRRSGP